MEMLVLFYVISMNFVLLSDSLSMLAVAYALISHLHGRIE